jgi:hypothetical protein
MESTSGISPSFLGLSRSSGQVTHVILTRSRLCPGPKPGSSLHLHVLSTPPAFVLSQDQTLRKKCDVTDRQSQESCHVADYCRRVHRAAAKHDGVINPHPVHDGRGSGSSNEGQECPSLRAAQFSKTIRRGRRVSPPPPSARFTKKAPRSRGPAMTRPRGGRSGLLLRGGSLRDPKQERPRSIARERPANARPFKNPDFPSGGRTAVCPPAGPFRSAPPPAGRADRRPGRPHRA